LEPDESRGSRPVLEEPGGEIPLGHSPGSSKTGYRGKTELTRIRKPEKNSTKIKTREP